jgi:hypothetical protein
MHTHTLLTHNTHTYSHTYTHTELPNGRCPRRYTLRNRSTSLPRIRVRLTFVAVASVRHGFSQHDRLIRTISAAPYERRPHDICVLTLPRQLVNARRSTKRPLAGVALQRHALQLRGRFFHSTHRHVRRTNAPIRARAIREPPHTAW